MQFQTSHHAIENIGPIGPSCLAVRACLEKSKQISRNAFDWRREVQDYWPLKGAIASFCRIEAIETARRNLFDQAGKEAKP
jgi:hypothetical protein